MKMHDDEVDIDAELVRRLVAAQFPRLAGRQVTPFRSTGTVNAIYRLGDDLYARLPRVARWARDLETESHWLPRLAPGAVIDWGAAGAGDPAADLIAAWAVFGPDGREAYRDALDHGDGAWDRARGVALHQAVMLIPYYRETNPGMAALGRRTVGQVLADLRPRGGDAAGPGPSARSTW